MELFTAHDSEPRPDKKALFTAEYCDPDRPVIELINGEVVRYDTILFYGTTYDRMVVLRSAPLHDGTGSRYWLGAYEHGTGEMTTYEVSDTVTIWQGPERDASGVLIRTAEYQAKSLSDETTVSLRFNNQSIVWQCDDASDPESIDMLPLPAQP